MFNALMTNKQTLPIGVTLLDQDGQPFVALPVGATISFVSDNPAVCGVALRPDGMNADITSGLVGTATITIHAEGVTPPVPDDMVVVTVVNSAPGSLNVTVGAPVDEPPPPPAP